MSQQLVAELCRALAGREGHAPLVGVTCRPLWKKRRVFWWNDYLKKEKGILGTVPEAEACAVSGALIEIMKNWREYAGRKNSRREVDRKAYPRALAARAAS